MTKKRKKKKHQDTVQYQYTVPFSVEEVYDFQKLIRDEELAKCAERIIFKTCEEEKAAFKAEQERLLNNAPLYFDMIYVAHRNKSQQMFEDKLMKQMLDNCFKPLTSKMHTLCQAKTVKVQNVHTGEVMEFMSRNDFKKHFKISGRMYTRFVKGEHVKCLSDWKLMN